MVINVYTLNPADQGLAGFALALGHNLCRPVRLLPLTCLPAPDVLRLQQKRVEQGELRDAIAAAAAHLACYAAGELPPDAGAEAGVRFTLESLKTRLNGVNAVLSSVEKGGSGQWVSRFQVATCSTGWRSMALTRLACRCSRMGVR